jgi:RNA polymerase sigma factor (sigma-70 family)
LSDDLSSGALSDDALMGRFCAGDESAFDTLYARHASAVLAFLVRMVRDPALAEDLLQTTFLSVVRARGRYEAGTAARSWIFAIAANAGRDALRRRRARPEDLSSTGASPEGAAVPAPVGDPGAERAVQDALLQLPVEQREAVILHKLQEMPFEEVATTLGISVSAAKVRAHRGYQRLRTLLAPFAGDAPE